jgi:hypothetical protein
MYLQKVIRKKPCKKILFGDIYQSLMKIAISKAGCGSESVST